MKWRMWRRGNEAGGLRAVCGNTVSRGLSDWWSNSMKGHKTLYTVFLRSMWISLPLAVETTQNWRGGVCVLSWSAGVWGCSDWQQNIAQTGTNGHHGTERNISFPLEPNVSCVSTSCGVHEIKTSDVYEVLYNIGANIYFSVLISYEHFACLVHSVTSTKNRNDIKAPHWIAGNL